jgi:virginiamycin B lyase
MASTPPRRIARSIQRRKRRCVAAVETLDRRELLAAFTLLSVPTPGAGLAGIAAGPDGSVWFAEQTTGNVGRVAPGGTISEIALGASSGPTGLTIGPDSNVWVTLQGSNRVARIVTTGSPTTTSYPITTPDAKPVGIASAAGALWFTESAVDKIGRVGLDGTLTEPVADPGDNPTAIVAAPDGGLWAVVTGAIVRIDPISGTKTDTRAFDAGSNPSDLAVGSDGNLWVTLAGTSRIARVNPGAGGTTTTFPLPAGAAPGSIVAGPDGALWFTEPSLSRVGRITTDGARIDAFAAPATAGALGEITASGGDLWITAPNSNQLVRLDSSRLVTVAAGPIAVEDGVAAPQVVATFTTDAVAPVASDFIATVDWGDGSPPTAGRVDAAPAGGFQVVGSHVYASAGTFTPSVTVFNGVGGVSGSATTSVAVSKAPPTFPLDFRLDASSDSGVSNSDRITNVSRPVFIGTASAYAIVQVYAMRDGSQPTETRYLGQAIVDGEGKWSLWSTFLPDGWYTVTAVQTPPGGSSSAPTPLAGPLVIDTVGPRVSGLAFDGPTNHATVVLSDVGAGLDPASADDPNAYTIVPPSTIIGAHPNPGRGQGPIRAPSISGFYSSADSYTVGLDFNTPRPINARSGRYMFQVASGGVRDLAGNGLDGEFNGQLPSGDGRPGGNFIARLTVPRQPVRRPFPHPRPRIR